VNRIVLDTNVWISGFIIPESKASRLMSSLIRGEQAGIISPYILAEIERTLSTSRLRLKYGIRRPDIVSLLLTLQVTLENVEPLAVSWPIRDPADLPILGTALAGRATHLITGDRDFLDDPALKAWMQAQNVILLAPGEFIF
jgi:uncharacterized protein